MASKKKHPGLGKMPKAAAGKCGPGMGGPLSSVDNTRINPTAPSSGKAHKSSGGGERKGFYPSAPSFPTATRARRASDRW
jgi:hypothetical protein